MSYDTKTWKKKERERGGEEKKEGQKQSFVFKPYIKKVGERNEQQVTITTTRCKQRPMSNSQFTRFPGRTERRKK